MMINKLRKFICFNQGQLLQYEYLVAKKHRLLRDYLNEIHCKKLSLSDIHKEELVKLLTNLYIDSEKNLIIILEKNFIKIQDIFNINDLHFTIKLLDLDENGKSVAYTFFDNSTHIKKDNQDSFLINQNARFDSIVTYGENHFADLEHNSNIVIPMTLRANEDLTQEFKKDFFTQESESHIWGFVCFDSKKNTFKNEHLELSHIIADIISLYFMFFHDHTEGSKSFYEALDLVGDDY